MQSKREPYLAIKKDKQQTIDHKIKLLEQIGEKQRNQVSKLLGRQSTPRASQYYKQQTSVYEPVSAQMVQNKSQTVRKRYRCQDYVPKPEPRLKQVQKVEPPEETNYIWNIHKASTNEQDHQLEYLKSEQYKQYLQALMQANSKEEKVKLIKENRNNNVYLGDKQQYIQSIIKTKQVLPRIKLQFGYNQSQYYDEDKIENHRHNTAANHRIKSIMAEDKRSLQNQGRKIVKVEIKKQQLQQSPIKSYPIFQVGTNREKQVSEAASLSPICQCNNMKAQFPPQQYRQHKKSQSQQVKQRLPLQLNVGKSTISTVSQKSATYGKSQIKNQTYRKELEYCQRKNITDRKVKKKDYGYKYKIIQEKEVQNKENRRQYTSPSFSHSSSEKNNIYDISFKISHPNQQKKQSRQPTTNRLIKHTPVLPKNTQQQKVTPSKYEVKKQRVHTEYRNLQWSRTTLATKQVDNYSNNKSRSKISVVSKSKLKR